MWTSNSMGFYDSLVTFFIGFSIVFICLIALAIFIILSSKIIAIISKSIPEEKVEATKTQSAPKVVENNDEDAEELAVIIAAVSEEMKLPVDKFKLVSIKEI